MHYYNWFLQIQPYTCTSINFDKIEEMYQITKFKLSHHFLCTNLKHQCAVMQCVQSVKRNQICLRKILKLVKNPLLRIVELPYS